MNQVDFNSETFFKQDDNPCTRDLDIFEEIGEQKFFTDIGSNSYSIPLPAYYENKLVCSDTVYMFTNFDIQPTFGAISSSSSPFHLENSKLVFESEDSSLVGQSFTVSLEI